MKFDNCIFLMFTIFSIGTTSNYWFRNIFHAFSSWWSLLKHINLVRPNDIKFQELKNRSSHFVFLFSEFRSNCYSFAKFNLCARSFTDLEMVRFSIPENYICIGISFFCHAVLSCDIFLISAKEIVLYFLT